MNKLFKDHRWVIWCMLIVIVSSITGWWTTREPIPQSLRIAAGKPGGQYYWLAGKIKTNLADKYSSQLDIIETRGSSHNLNLVHESKVDFAIIQMGTNLGENSEHDYGLVTPLYPEVIHIIVRADSDIVSLNQLVGKKVAIGSVGSGTRESAMGLIQHYGIKESVIEISNQYFLDITKDASLDAAMLTSGIMHPDLVSLLSSGEYRLIDIPDAKGISLRRQEYSRFIIPRGMYRGGKQSIPKDDVQSIATMAVLVAKPNTSATSINAMLSSIYESKLPFQIPVLLKKQAATKWTVYPKIPEAESYFNPYRGINLLATFMESLAAAKELIVAFAAALYLMWDAIRRRKQTRLNKELSAQKERLDHYLQETIRIERQYLHETNSKQLMSLMNDVTQIKLNALEEFTHEELRADRSLLIFLTQCANLINKIQAKINLCTSNMV